jgi:hypothetical protein
MTAGSPLDCFPVSLSPSRSTSVSHRYLDVTRFGELTSSGEPATMVDLGAMRPPSPRSPSAVGRSHRHATSDRPLATYGSFQ